MEMQLNGWHRRIVIMLMVITAFTMTKTMHAAQGPGLDVDGWINALTKAKQDYLAKQGNKDNQSRPNRYNPSTIDRYSIDLMNQYPVMTDWLLQDNNNSLKDWFEKSGTAEAAQEYDLVKSVAGAAKADQLKSDKIPGDDARWLHCYIEACLARRADRLKSLTDSKSRIVFTKHFNLGGSHYAYTEGQSDAQSERQFAPRGSLCLLEMDGLFGRIETLLHDDKGVIRDPAISYDGQSILFAWKKSDREDDYHLYEMDVDSKKIKTITSGLGYADYEGAYLPNGDIIFNSTRCVQTVDCWWTEVSNLYTCDRNGKYLRRLTYDQVHDNYPTVLEDGRVIYTRWEYNDRGQLFPQPLLQMNQDGTNQNEFYGVNSWFPTTVMHARGIPGTKKLLALASGHHTRQTGKLCIIDPGKGRHENEGVQLIAPVRKTDAVRVDAYGQDGDLFQYPYPLNENECLVTYSPFGWIEGQPMFRLYHMDMDGHRELIAWDKTISCNQPVLLASREVPHVRPTMVDYTKKTGTYYIQDIYEGPGLKGIERGTIKKVRVVSIDYRVAGIRFNNNGGPGGGALVSTPVATGNGAWDPKIVLGEATVYDDGSACFETPSRMPVYFQAIDKKGYVVQTMRSWSTLQPGENLSCIGCHESKNTTPVTGTITLAMKAGPQKLKPFYGPARGFSYAKEVQPILDKHCISCHHDRKDLPEAVGTIPPFKKHPSRKAFSLLGATIAAGGEGRLWSDSYLKLTNSRVNNKNEWGEFYVGDADRGYITWVSSQSVPTLLEPYSAGAAKSKLMRMMDRGHKGVKLSQKEKDIIACWIDLAVPYCGDYTEANIWTDKEKEKYAYYLKKRTDMEQLDKRNIRAYLAKLRRENPLAADEDSSNQQITVKVFNKTLQEITSGKSDSDTVKLSFNHSYQPGDMIEINGPNYLIIQLDQNMKESLVYSETGRFIYPVLSGNERDAYRPKAFAGDNHTLIVRPATDNEIYDYQNLAKNPYALHDQSDMFPFASSNSECRGDAAFFARNAIDGMSKNDKHGHWPDHSWGPDQRTDLWWQIDFGRPVEVDKIVLSIRADFPHDRHWHQGRLVFSDGSEMPINLKKTGDKQTITFDKRQVEWVRIDQLVQDEPLGWCGFTEVEVYGKNIKPFTGLRVVNGQ